METKIPKIIHYCWFGGELPPKMKENVLMWQRMMPSYKFICWNDSNFDTIINPYVAEAYDKGKYAFVSDVARLYALYNIGGIYLDTDVEVLRSFDDLLDEDGFAGFEGSGRVATCVIGSKKANILIEMWIESYKDRRFVTTNGSFDETPNTLMFTKMLAKIGLKPENTVQSLNGFTVYPEEWFCPYNPWNEKTIVTKNTYTKHLFLDTWNDSISSELEYIRKIDGMINRLIEQSTKIKGMPLVLYGMGVVCRCVIDELKKYPDIVVKGIVVTKRDNDWDIFYGIPILEEIENYKGNKEDNVLVCTIPKYHKEIIEILIKNEFKNIYCMDD